MGEGEPNGETDVERWAAAQDRPSCRRPRLIVAIRAVHRQGNSEALASSRAKPRAIRH